MKVIRMQIVIDINDEVREHILDLANDGKEIPLGINAHMIRAIANGMPLPKGHGRLIDGDDALDRLDSGYDYDVIRYAPTVLEADKEI